MGHELRDLRAKITVLTDAVLDSLSNARGVDRSELVRVVLHRWALEQSASIPQAAKLLAARLKAEGISGDDPSNGQGVAPQHAQDLEATGIHRTIRKKVSDGDETDG